MKALHLFNSIGILVVAGLCLVQWRVDQRLTGELADLGKSRSEQDALIAEQTGQLERLRADLAGVQERFAGTSGRIEKAEGQLSDATRQVRLLTLERDQLKDSITNWMSAVTQRDERIKEGNTQIRKLADDLTASVNKFNSLATNYNATVQQLNEVVTNRNELITRYNTLVEEVNKAREQEAKK